MTVRVPGVRRVCVAVDIVDASRFTNQSRLAAQQILVDAMERAYHAAGARLDDCVRESKGDGEVAVLPPGLDEAEGIPRLIQELEVELSQANTDRSESARLRVRLAIHEGIVFEGPGGLVGRAVDRTCRLMDSTECRQAVKAYPEADLVLMVSEPLYEDVLSHGFRHLKADQFTPVRARVPGKGFAADAWLYVPGVPGGGIRGVVRGGHPDTDADQLQERRTAEGGWGPAQGLLG